MGDIVQLNEGEIKNQLGEMVRKTVEETLNNLLDAEADQSHRHTGMNDVKTAQIHAPDITHENWSQRPERYL